MSDDLPARMRAAMKAIRPVAAKAEVLPQHWIHGSDEGLDWCPDCGEKEVDRLSNENPDEEHFLDGGSMDHQGDSPSFCEGCGALLGYTLTNYGAEAELSHFLENGVAGRDGSLSPITAHEILAMLDIFDHDGCEHLHEAVKVAEEAASLAAGLQATPETPGPCA